MERKTFTAHANGMDFYCEMMGQGPTIVIVPDGGNDCGPYEKMMDYLSDEFTVLTFDPRGGSRSPDPHPRPVTPELFSDDIAALVQEVEVETPISAFGVSSGDMGQYFEEDFAHMAPVDFIIGTWTPSWLTAANQATAARGNRPVTWVNSSHAPHVTMPKEMAEIVREKVKQYVRA